MKIAAVEARSALVRSKLPDTDWVINPYIGCAAKCAYCYASFMGRFVGETIENWGEYVYVKSNIAEVLDRELDKRSKSFEGQTVLLSSVTDAWQGIEKKFELTRKILKVLVLRRFSGCVAALTKFPLITRDIDLLADLPAVDLGMTITTTDDAISKFLEMAAPSASQRLDALRQLNARGFRTYAFVGPLLPHFVHEPDKLVALFGAIKDAGTNSIYVEHLNTSKYILMRLRPELARARPEVRSVYEQANSAEHRQRLDRLVLEIADHHRLQLRLEKVLLHRT